ncbi:MAG: SAF domain-containing protein [Catenulispora sp.]
MIGVLLVAGCGLASLLVSVRLGGRLPVLATARAVAVGHVLEEADLRVVRVATDRGVGVVGAGNRRSVIGRPVAVPLPAGVLLSPSMVGSASWPPAGLAVVAVQVKPGQFPPEVAAGAQVAVMVASGGDASSGGTAASLSGGQPGSTRGALVATVVGVTEAGADTPGAMVVSLLSDSSEALMVARAPAGQVSLVLLSPVGAP